MNFSTSSDQIFLDQEQEKTKRIGIDSEMDAYQTVMFFCPYFTRQHAVAVLGWGQGGTGPPKSCPGPPKKTFLIGSVVHCFY